MKKEFLEQCLAERLSLEQIGARVGRSPSTVSYHLKKHDLTPTNQGKHANRGGIPRDTLKELVSAGLSLRQIADRVDRSYPTVRYWVQKYRLNTRRVGLRRPELKAARERGDRYVESRCAHHGDTTFVLEGMGYYRCMKCRQDRVSEWRRRAKRRLVETAGGACSLCGYDSYPGALQFHHAKPDDKEFAISRKGVTRSFAELQSEAAKCVLLCANCHAEVEGGYAVVPPEMASDIA